MTDLKRVTTGDKEQKDENGDKAQKDAVLTPNPPVEAYENINAPNRYPDDNGAFCPQAPRE